MSIGTHRQRLDRQFHQGARICRVKPREIEMTEAATSQERRKIGDMSRGKIECFQKRHAPSELHTGDFRIGKLQRANAKKARAASGGRLSIGHSEKSNDSTGNERIVCQSSVLAPMTARPESSMSRRGAQVLHLRGTPNDHVERARRLKVSTNTRVPAPFPRITLQSGFVRV